MVKFDVIVTGSEGLLGKTLCDFLIKKNLKVGCLDQKLGHDLENEDFVSKWFRLNQGHALVNLFAKNNHIESDRFENSFLDIKLSNFTEYLITNVTTLFSVCREFIRNNKSGNIVNFSSIYGVSSPVPSLYKNSEKSVAYGVSKSAVIQLSRHLAVHTAPNFRINTIILGGVEHEQPQDFKDLYARMTPMGRMARANEINGIVDFLISENSSYCTGGLFPADGGWTSW